MQHSGISETRYGRCPRCKSTDLHLSRYRNLLERFCGPVISPWRCNICFARFFRPFWFKAEPRKVDLRKHFDKQPAPPEAKSNSASFSASEESLPGFIKRNPALAFLVPTRRHVRHVKHTVPFGTK
jgi:hypothetical protein